MLEECFSWAIRGGTWWHSRNSAGWEFGLRGTTRSGTKGVHCTDLGQLKNHQKGDFPGTSNAGGRNSITGQEIKIPYATWPSAPSPSLPRPAKKKKKEKITRKGRSRNRQQQRELHGQTGKVLVTQSCSTLRGPMDCSPPGPSVHGVLQARILRVRCHSLLQGIFLTQRSNLSLLHCRQILLPSEPPGQNCNSNLPTHPNQCSRRTLLMAIHSRQPSPLRLPEDARAKATVERRLSCSCPDEHRGLPVYLPPTR